MPEATATFEVRRQGPRVVDIRGRRHGRLGGRADERLRAATRRRREAIVLNFTGLAYMNSGGIGLLVTLLVRANRHAPAAARLRAVGPLPPDLRADPPRRGGRHPRHRGRRAGRGRRRMRRSDDERRQRDRPPRATPPTGPSPVSTLNVAEVPEGAININVEGKRLAGPIQGFGKMWQKTYQVRLPRERVSAAELIATWKQRFPEFWPEGNRFYGPLTGIAPGEVALLNMTLPGQDEALDRRDGALRRRGVVHADDAAGPHVRRLDHVQRDRASTARPSPRRRC